ncbi:MAG: DUF389 domain-containing protein [Flavobacteriaceae bacterium]|nr:DUF389 domain-containing protein [Flavobacteriaceae bacterium]
METNQTAGESPKIDKKNLQTVFDNFKHFFLSLLDIKSETDKEESIESIKRDIPFRGHNAWILIFSVFIASIGLNVSSTAVVIGAMLISPLMGPIVGLGLSVAVNDVDTLRKSLVNLGVMVGLSVFTAFLYFKLSPLTELTPELEARTYPTILDVMVAVFGGLALIVARTKKGTMASAIFGVAIATALMPPLCTAGYGFAVWEPRYFGGALYLFTINAIFIALTTFLVAKLLRFPMVKYANSIRRRRISQLASLVAFLVMVPSIFLFYVMLKETVFKRNIREFISNEITASTNYNLIKDLTEITYEYKGASRVDLYFMGNENIPEGVIDLWRNKLKSDAITENTALIIHQNEKGDAFDELNYIKELRSRDMADLKNKDEKISFLENEVNRLGKLDSQSIPFDEIAKELKINYQEVSEIYFSNRLYTNFSEIDTLIVFDVKWIDSIPQAQIQSSMPRIASWLKFKLQKDTLLVRRLD